jgi:hypothetical protein
MIGSNPRLHTAPSGLVAWHALPIDLRFWEPSHRNGPTGERHKANRKRCHQQGSYERTFEIPQFLLSACAFFSGLLSQAQQRPVKVCARTLRHRSRETIVCTALVKEGI